MRLYVKDLKSLTLRPTTTVADIKKYIRDNGYDVNTAVLTFGNNQTLSPVVFQTNNYDNVNLESYRNYLENAVLNVEINRYTKQKLDFPLPDPENPYMVHSTEVSILEPHGVKTYMYFRTLWEMQDHVHNYVRTLGEFGGDMFWFTSQIRVKGNIVNVFTVGVHRMAGRDTSAEENIYFTSNQQEVDSLYSGVNRLLEGVENNA